MVKYKVVETTIVSEEVLEEILNECTGKGWVFHGMHFAVKETSKRPTMAFLIFTRPERDGTA